MSVNDPLRIFAVSKNGTSDTETFQARTWKELRHLVAEKWKWTDEDRIEFFTYWWVVKTGEPEHRNVSTLYPSFKEWLHGSLVAPNLIALRRSETFIHPPREGKIVEESGSITPPSELSPPTLTTMKSWFGIGQPEINKKGGKTKCE